MSGGRYGPQRPSLNSPQARTKPQPAVSAKQKVKTVMFGVLAMAIVIPLLVWVITMAGGKPPAKSDLVGTWVHHGNNLRVSLQLKGDGTFTREPNISLSSNVWGGDIPTEGTWTLDEGKNTLLLTGPPTSGEFRPLLSGGTLELRVMIDGRLIGSFKFEKM